jgi:hypothetical protein
LVVDALLHEDLEAFQLVGGVAGVTYDDFRVDPSDGELKFVFRVAVQLSRAILYEAVGIDGLEPI